MSVSGGITLINTILDIWRKRPAQLKKQALASAKKYISINETGKRHGRKLSAKSKVRWLLHYKKQVDAWGG